MSNDQVQRIEAMEWRMDAAKAVVDKVSAALEELEAAREEFGKLADYYGSEQWFEDVDDADQGVLPESMKCGVLTEDLPYDVVTGWRALGIRLLEAGTASIEQV